MNVYLIRYIIESDSRIRTIFGKRVPETSVVQDSAFVEHDTRLCWLPTIIKDFILPAGFPGDTRYISTF